MSISFMGDKVVAVQMGCTSTMGNIAYSVDDDCNWLTAKDMFAIAEELEKRNNENHL